MTYWKGKSYTRYKKNNNRNISNHIFYLQILIPLVVFTDKSNLTNLFRAKISSVGTYIFFVQRHCYSHWNKIERWPSQRAGSRHESALGKRSGRFSEFQRRMKNVSGSTIHRRTTQRFKLTIAKANLNVTVHSKKRFVIWFTFSKRVFELNLHIGIHISVLSNSLLQLFIIEWWNKYIVIQN